MSKRLIGVLGATLLLFSLSIIAFGQTVTRSKQFKTLMAHTPIVEYPVGQGNNRQFESNRPQRR